MKKPLIRTESWARKNGFTRHARLHGIPAWMDEPDGGPFGPVILGKTFFHDIAIDIGELVFQIGVALYALEPVYVIKVGKRIDGGRHE